MSSLWDNSFEKQKAIKLDGTLQVCSRCKLPAISPDKNCEHCAHVEDDQLEQVRKDYDRRNNIKKVQTKIAFLWGMTISIILLIIFLIIF